MAALVGSQALLEILVVFLPPPLTLKFPTHFMRYVAAWWVFLCLRSVFGQQLVASIRMYLTLFQRRGGVPTLYKIYLFLFIYLAALGLSHWITREVPRSPYS